MASPEHHNFDYSGGSPLAIGDRYYAQDLGRDYYYLLNRQGALLKAFIGSTNVILSGGVASVSDWTHVDITAARVLVQYSITVPDSYATIPPTIKFVKLDGLLVEMPAQTAWELSGATLDGFTSNYLKLAYANASGSSRTRALAGGSYVYDQTASFTLTCTPVAATDTEVLLATIVGDGASVMTITPASKPTVAQTVTTSAACSGNALTATTSAACSGNALTATTSAACSGNALTATTSAACSGNALTATTLQSSRNFSVSGIGMTCSAQAFNGSANVTLPLAYINTQGAAGTWDTSATAPDQTTRLNWNGYLYATRVYNAIYNDLAEFMDKKEGDNSYPGDVLVQTEYGLVKSFKKADKAVVGVYSDSFGYALGAENKDKKYPVGLSGVVFVKVKEVLEIGDLLVSGKDGFAIKARRIKSQGIVIGKVLENKKDHNISRIKMLILK
jgi:hypothetical protein